MPRRANGEGQIRKRFIKREDGSSYKRWFARITTRWDGKKQSFKDGPLRKTQDEAKLDLVKLKLQLSRGSLSGNNDQTLNEYIESWLESASRNKKYRTYQSYSGDLYNHVLPEIGYIKLGKLRRTDVQRMCDAVYEKLLAKGKDGRAVVRKCRASLRTALQDHIDLQDPDSPGAMYFNPCERVKVPGESIDEVELWTPEEARRFLEHARSKRLYPILYTAMTSGLREGELLGLRWQDLETYPDPDTEEMVGQLHIRKAIVYVPKKDHEIARRKPGMTKLHGNLFLDDPKTAKSKGFVTIPSDTVEVLRQHRQNQRDEAKRFREWHDYSLIFPAKFGTPMSPKSLQDAYRKLLEEADVPKVKFHDLRDTHATYLLIIGEDLGTVSDRLRHSTKSTTLNRYVQVLNKRRRKAARTMNELLSDPD